MFVRFVTPIIHPESGVATGLFRAFGFYEDEGLIPDCYQDRLDELFDWFNENLPVPYRLSRAIRRFRIAFGVCWLKPSALNTYVICGTSPRSMKPVASRCAS